MVSLLNLLNMALITVNNKKKAGFALGRLSLVIDKLMPYLRVNSISWHLSQIVVCPISKVQHGRD